MSTQKEEAVGRFPPLDVLRNVRHGGTGKVLDTALRELVLLAQSCWALCDSIDCSPPGDLPDSGIKPRSAALQGNSLPSEPPWQPLGELIVL